MIRRNAVGLAALALLTGWVSCTPAKSSDDSGEPDPGVIARYEERAGENLKIVSLNLTDCSLSLRGGPADALQGNRATCSEAEFERVQELLSPDSWEAYDGLGGTSTAGPAGAGGGTPTADGANGEDECETPDCSDDQAGDPSSPGPSGASPDGTVSVRRAGETKVFPADATGNEGQLIQFFRELYETYRQF